jgi:hypothetical protein
VVDLCDRVVRLVDGKPAPAPPEGAAPAPPEGAAPAPSDAGAPDSGG